MKISPKFGPPFHAFGVACLFVALISFGIISPYNRTYLGKPFGVTFILYGLS